MTECNVFNPVGHSANFANLREGDLIQAMLVERFGLSLSNVKSILSGRSWKHILPPTCPTPS
jgi:hypothetical protein